VHLDEIVSEWTDSEAGLPEQPPGFVEGLVAHWDLQVWEKDLGGWAVLPQDDPTNRWAYYAITNADKQ
jgi:hypothetical protein